MSAVTLFGVAALTFMMLMYALERRGPRFILLFALGCALSSAYGFLSGAWPFGVVEAIWAVIALRRYTSERHSPIHRMTDGAAGPAVIRDRRTWRGKARPVVERL